MPTECREESILARELGFLEGRKSLGRLVVHDFGAGKVMREDFLVGGAALGHPLGATGAIRAATAIHALRRNNLKYGMVTMCVGAGMGAAGIFERV